EQRFEQSLDRTIERPWAWEHGAVGLVRNLAHDSVAMEVVIQQREEDLESGRREWVEFSFWHKVVSIISISMNDYTPSATTSATLIWLHHARRWCWAL